MTRTKRLLLSAVALTGALLMFLSVLPAFTGGSVALAAGKKAKAHKADEVCTLVSFSVMGSAHADRDARLGMNVKATRARSLAEERAEQCAVFGVTTAFVSPVSAQANMKASTTTSTSTQSTTTNNATTANNMTSTAQNRATTTSTAPSAAPSTSTGNAPSTAPVSGGTWTNSSLPLTIALGFLLVGAGLAVSKFATK